MRISSRSKSGILGLISESAVQETAKSFLFYYETIQKGHAEGSHQALSNRPDRRLPLSGYRRRDEYPADCSQILASRKSSIQQGFEIFWDGISIKKEEARIREAALK